MNVFLLSIKKVEIDFLSWRFFVLAQSERINETYHSTNNVAERLANNKNGEVG